MTPTPHKALKTLILSLALILISSSYSIAASEDCISCESVMPSAPPLNVLDKIKQTGPVCYLYERDKEQRKSSQEFAKDLKFGVIPEIDTEELAKDRQLLRPNEVFEKMLSEPLKLVSKEGSEPGRGTCTFASDQMVVVSPYCWKSQNPGATSFNVWIKGRGTMYVYLEGSSSAINLNDEAQLLIGKYKKLIEFLKVRFEGKNLSSAWSELSSERKVEELNMAWLWLSLTENEKKFSPTFLKEEYSSHRWAFGHKKHYRLAIKEGYVKGEQYGEPVQIEELVDCYKELKQNFLALWKSGKGTYAQAIKLLGPVMRSSSTISYQIDIGNARTLAPHVNKWIADFDPTLSGELKLNGRPYKVLSDAAAFSEVISPTADSLQKALWSAASSTAWNTHFSTHSSDPRIDEVDKFIYGPILAETYTFKTKSNLDSSILPADLKMSELSEAVLEKIEEQKKKPGAQRSLQNYDALILIRANEKLRQIAYPTSKK